MSARWYKRCGADFIHGTMMLTLEEKGAYSLCLDLIYDRGGPIPDDARWLSGVCGVSIRKWNAIRERLLSLGKLLTDGQWLSNSRADLEMLSSKLQSEKLAESGAKGGRKRAENAGESLQNSDLAQAPLKLIREDKSREEEDTPDGVLSAPAEIEDDLKPEHVVEAWNEMAGRIGLSKARLTPERRKKLNTFIRRHSVEDIATAIQLVPESPFLRGEGRGGWKANFDFLLQPSSFTKVLERSYD